MSGSRHRLVSGGHTWLKLKTDAELGGPPLAIAPETYQLLSPRQDLNTSLKKERKTPYCYGSYACGNRRYPKVELEFTIIYLPKVKNKLYSDFILRI